MGKVSIKIIRTDGKYGKVVVKLQWQIISISDIGEYFRGFRNKDILFGNDQVGRGKLNG